MKISVPNSVDSLPLHQSETTSKRMCLLYTNNRGTCCIMLQVNTRDNPPFIWLLVSFPNIITELWNTSPGQPTKYTHASDVYSYAILLWTLWTGMSCDIPNNHKNLLFSFLGKSKPYGWQAKHTGRMNMKKFMKKISGPEGLEGMRLPIPHSMPENWRILMRKCWDPDPDKRPSFETIKLTLNHIWEEWQIAKPEKNQVKKDGKEQVISAAIADFGRTISDDTGQLSFRANIIDRRGLRNTNSSSATTEEEEEDGSGGGMQEKEGAKESSKERRRRKKEEDLKRKEEEAAAQKDDAEEGKDSVSKRNKKEKKAAVVGKGKGKRSKMPHFF